MGLISRAQQLIARTFFHQDSAPKKEAPPRYMSAIEANLDLETPLSKRRLSKAEKAINFLDRHLFKPLNLFQGTLKALSGTPNDATPPSVDSAIQEGVTPTSAKAAEIRAAAQAMWQSFDDPNKAYVVIFPNNKSGFMHGSEHAGIMIGHSDGYEMDNTASYSSWSFDEDSQGVLGPFNTKRSFNTFEQDYMTHGKPVVIELEGMNIGAMQRMWGLIQVRNKRYRLLGLNCSTVVFRILRKGLTRSQRKHLFFPKGFWTPHDLHKLAGSIKQQLANK
ncbi:hypothetical protein [Parendozoicomonas sp. Alg238-R29]|uniref:hypothetical protein n=1 Tax=Parendozoicomonas sp. Alg238-R29 TaxID=2993446 RepID=UPI00248DFA3C|nr:hypothetical protein [Parendozoicomonas sp. Alg238-R29]